MNQDTAVDFLKFMFRHSQATGSSEYALANPADYDRFCTQEHFDAILTEAGNLGLEAKPSASAYACIDHSANITVLDKTFHLFVVKASDIVPFQLATMATASMCKAYPLAGAVKALRVQYFRSVRDMAMMWGSLVSVRMVVDVSVKDGKAESA